MPELLQLLALDQKVTFGPGDEPIKGKITAVNIRRYNITYELTYWLNSEKKTIWLSEEEFQIKKPKQQTVGFLNEKTNSTD